MTSASTIAGRPERLGLLFLGAPSVPEMVALARRAEARGFDSVWIAETRLTRDGIVPLTAMAMGTERIRVGTGIINVYTRGPAVIAITFLGLEELAPGRICMGLGAGSPLVLAPQGVPFDKPLTRVREYVEVIPRLMRGEEVTYHGETVRLEAARVEDLLASGLGGDGRVPLWLAATGPRMLEYAGEVADGVMLNACLPAEYVERSLERIERGARRAGRSLADLEISMAIVCAPAEDSAAGKDKARRFIALYLSLFPNIAAATGLAEAWCARLRATFERDGLEAAVPLVDDAVVDRLSAAGTVEECRRRLDDYRRAGVGLPVLAPMDGTMDLVIDRV